jgi:hypothetical protein
MAFRTVMAGALAERFASVQLGCYSSFGIVMADYFVPFNRYEITAVPMSAVTGLRVES